MAHHAAPLLPGRILAAAHAVEPFGYAIRRPTGTQDWLLTCTRSGTGQYRQPSLVHQCSAGTLMLLAPGAYHDYATATVEQDWDFCWTHFLPRPEWTAWLGLPVVGAGLSGLTLRDPVLEQRIASAFERLIRDNYGAGTLGKVLALNALEEILILVAQYQQHVVTRHCDPRIEAVLRALAEQRQSKLDIAVLSRMVALSPSRLAHLFKQQTGDSIMQMHLKLRLRQAAQLLECTTHTVGQVANDTGFESPFYFSRQFKAAYGVSPQAYRQLLVPKPPNTVV